MIRKLLDWLNPYTKYEFVREITSYEDETKQIAICENPSDILDFDMVKTGKKVKTKHALYKASSKRTGLPKFKLIKVK